MEPYKDSDSKYSVDLVELTSEPAEIQLQEMEAWFRAHYEDPGERTPYESSEGGYQYIWGGPYEAEDVLYDKFTGYVPSELINQLIDKLQEDCMEWAPTPSEDDYETFYAEAAIKSSEHFAGFEWNIAEIKSMLDVEVPKHRKNFLNRLLYASVITAMESYLSDVFISTVAGSSRYLAKFIETHEAFTSKKIKLSEVVSRGRTIKDDAKKEMARISFHNIPKAQKLFKATLSIQFPEKTEVISKAVRIRHDLIHRAGFTLEGKPHYLEDPEIYDLIRAVERFVAAVDSELQLLRSSVQIENEEGHECF